ncbi:protein bark beetle isoform X3 [Thrips palmi]|uniref:Protein bark beetle isoform X3 n=1 Tax=Thrips palmi TaxID=161013 RepID=A0A6P8Z4T6_THRPL|nr:protein bark beetle isoform X3 [Thrips palmi]
MERARSPYLLREDLIIDKTGELIIEPGVEVRFAPMTGITVHGVLTARGTPDERILLTSQQQPGAGAENPEVPPLRLVDGPSILAGRMQIFHRGQWRSVCTNSRNWTRADLETACRHLGFHGGSWWSWVDRQPGVKPRLLWEEPRCRGTETELMQCDWNSRQLGSGVCDYHPDLGIQCSPFHVSSQNVVHHWRGLRFDRASHERMLTQRNTLYIKTSLSELANVEIRYAGVGRDYNATSAIDVIGVPPKMIAVAVTHSAYNGVNITMPSAPIVMKNCTLRNNRGYGVFMNSSSGLAHIENSLIMENGGDGIRYIHHDLPENARFDRSEIFDFCTFPTTASQTFPITISVEQGHYSPAEKDCSKYFFTRPGHVLTLHFLQVRTDRNESAKIEVYDGANANDELLATIVIRNGTKPQSITTTRHNVYVRFRAQPKTQLVGFLQITSGYRKSYDLNVTGTTIADNNGRGIAAENLRSQIHVHQSSVSNNNHVAGVHVLGGAADVNITDSRIAFNMGDGVNISYTGGSRNISYSWLSSNKGYGMAVWLNDSKYMDHVAFHQETVIAYSEIYKNLDTGILVGNFCGPSFVNITGNGFNNSLNTALEILSCWKANVSIPTKLQIGHNTFVQNKRLGIKMKPVLNMKGKIEYNHFTEHAYGGLLIRNPRIEGEEHQELLPVSLTVQYNDFSNNKGVFAVSLGLNQYAEKGTQYLLFTRNFVRYNRIHEPYETGIGESLRLIPRSRVAAPVVVSSSNVDIFRNIIENHESQYEVGSHLEDQSQVINCTYNWLGNAGEDKIFMRLFHRKDRYNLAKIEYLPFLLHSSNPGATIISVNPTFVPQFHAQGSSKVGGEVDGQETLRAGEYLVERDINVRPGGKLVLQPGVTLRFPPSVGMMVAGKLEARGKGPNDIRLTLREERIDMPENDTDPTLLIPEENRAPVRLLGGRTNREGRLQVRIDGAWGTVCNYGWTRLDAALVCHQLGLVLNPDDWFLERSEIPQAGTTENILLSNVRCDDDDTDITQCRAERPDEFEFSCSHENDVGIRCYDTSWAGIRLGVVAERADLQFITVEKAGLLDYTTNAFKPALQIDFARHALESVRIVDNLQDGLGIIYSDLYTSGGVNTVRNCEFSNNRGSGVSLKQLGLKIYGSTMENNKQAGIRHNPALSGVQQRELAGWFKPPTDLNTQYAPYSPLYVPHTFSNIELDDWETRHLITQRVTTDPIKRSFFIKCKPGFVIGVQLLNPIHNRSTEEIIVRDAHSQSGIALAAAWNVKRDLTIFPAASSSYGIIIEYNSGVDALGGCVLVLSSVQVPLPDPRLRLVRGPVPTLTVTNSRIRGNRRGLWASYYNRYLTEHEDNFLRKANESIQLLGCDISHNQEDALHIHSPFWDIHKSNLSEITIVINSSLIVDNGRGIYQFSRDMRSSNNLFHWILFDNSIERNNGGGFDVSLPYVWQYNENYTHTFFLSNNTWRDNRNFAFVIDGHFAALNLTKNIFDSNQCKTGLISVRGMEKRMNIYRNRIERNTGAYMVEFRADSQSEIMGNVDAYMIENELRHNRDNAPLQRGYFQVYRSPSCVVGFHGIQKVRVRRNLFSNNELDYVLVAGVRTAQLASTVDVSENWWGTPDAHLIRQRIFDFDDWNNHAQAEFRPYLLQDNFDASLSVSFEQPVIVDTNNLGGRYKDSLRLFYRPEPYRVYSDITILPDAVMTIDPGVIMEFAPNVGILVLGTLRAQGRRGLEIVMKPLQIRAHNNGPAGAQPGTPVAEIPSNHLVKKRAVEYPYVASGHFSDSIRLCTGRNCTQQTNEGFLEYYNRTTLQWVPMCDDRFTERNAQVVCRELGFDSLNVFVNHGQRVEFHYNSLSRIWSWPEPLQCKGDESKLEDCAIRLNGQLYGHRHRCEWDSPFVFIHCGKRNLYGTMDYWGGVRFANAEFEQNLYEHRIHDVVTHETTRRSESFMENVKIIGAGILHNEKSPAIQAVVRSPTVMSVNISRCASHGINMISPAETVRLLFNRIEDTLGVGINAISLTGEGRESESSFNPLRDINLPYHVFSLIDICDPTKVITIEERVLVYYKYDNHAVNCVKIFNSVYHVKPFGFRLLQFNLFNTSSHPGRPDSITLYDGDIYNISASVLATIEVGGGMERKLFRTQGPKLSLKLFANGGSQIHGFIAEIVTLPISAIGFNRDVQHNISFSAMIANQRGAVSYISAGEVNPAVTLEWNQIRGNGNKLYGNFTSAEAAVMMDVQNTQNIFFRNNLVEGNTGGLWIRSDSGGSATALKGWVHNNLFTDNAHRPALYVEGRQSSPYQEVTIYRNYFTRNYSPYNNVIVLKQVVSNFTYNYLHRNWGGHILEVSGFEKVRLPIYQTTSHNGFYFNYAMDRESRGTIVAGTAGQHYVDNVLFDPDNDYEIVTVNRSRSLDVWKTPIDAKHNWWGYNESLAVLGRIKDRADDPDLLEVDFRPYHMNNRTVLSGKCPPGWALVGDTCYIYIGAPMTFHDARNFCRSDNASMPYVMSNYVQLYHFLQRQQQGFQLRHHVWVQNIDRINQCTAFAYQTVEVDHCERLNPFVCEMDPGVHIDPLSWREDVVTIAVLGVVGAALVLVALAAGFWFTKSRRRQEERFQRRNSIRQSLHSVRSLGSVHGTTFSELGYRRKEPFTGAHNSQRSSPTLTKGSDYKKMNGSLDSMDKSQFNSSVEDTQSFDIYETHNPQAAAMSSIPLLQTTDARGGYAYQTPSDFRPTGEVVNPAFDLSFRNEGFRDNSTFASRDNSLWQSTAGSELGGGQSPSEGADYLTNASTLPLNTSFAMTDSTLGVDVAVTPAYSSEATYRPTDTPDPYYDHRERLREVSESYFDPKGSPKNFYSTAKPTPEPFYQSTSGSSEPMYNLQERPKSSHMVLESNLDIAANENGLPTPPHPPSRSKSEVLLETNFDVYVPPSSKPSNTSAMTPASRSKSQPLETAM